MLTASIKSRFWRFTRKRRATTLDGTGKTAVWAACGKSDKLGTCLNLKFSSSMLRWFVSEAPQPCHRRRCFGYEWWIMGLMYATGTTKPCVPHAPTSGAPSLFHDGNDPCGPTVLTPLGKDTAIYGSVRFIGSLPLFLLKLRSPHHQMSYSRRLQNVY